MAPATLVLPPQISQLISDALEEELETAGVLLVGEGTRPHGATRCLRASCTSWPSRPMRSVHATSS